ncbi:hypothetical protein LRP31_23600 [Mesorhizobium mediterraneum]|uniref:DUF3024 domain-containing protein n=1 Tax=Mesorhizobium mediterraneum TaxID=43617 RepID=A0AB36R026_9HYPH|nr:hypothetical protein [Mesorhizobium mediterraneum]PAP97800.1 hypothetical protein CIT25_35015 [Mesorhizobium mediterraneum]WIW52032.1 hypothetical protein LRP31_23600 [Mesorhizobium mediterraneum]
MFHFILSSIKSIINKDPSKEFFIEIKEAIGLDDTIDDQSVDLSLIQVTGPVSVPDNRERSDTYTNIVFRINDRWRVIICPEGIQWILQKRKGNLDGRPAWNGVKFCRSKVGLSRALKEEVGDVSPEVDAQLAQLPDWIES